MGARGGRSSDGDAVARRVVVTGRVQGVFFRDTCGRLAREAGVSGWIANRDDGAVEAWFEGRSDDVGRLVEWCRHGPEHAVVEQVRVHDETPTGAAGFRVR